MGENPELTVQRVLPPSRRPDHAPSCCSLSAPRPESAPLWVCPAPPCVCYAPGAFRPESAPIPVHPRPVCSTPGAPCPVFSSLPVYSAPSLLGSGCSCLVSAPLWVHLAPCLLPPRTRCPRVVALPCPAWFCQLLIHFPASTHSALPSGVETPGQTSLPRGWAGTGPTSRDILCAFPLSTSYLFASNLLEIKTFKAFGPTSSASSQT